MKHAEFLEALAGGLINWAYNDTRGRRSGDKVDIATAPPLRTLDLMGLAPSMRSAGATDGRAGGVTRSLESTSIRRRLLPDAPGPGDHKLVPVPECNKISGRKNNPYCGYLDCDHARACKTQKCGEGSVREQGGRSRASWWCPVCQKAFHPDCAGIYHKWWK